MNTRAETFNQKLRQDARWAQFQQAWPGWDIRFQDSSRPDEHIDWIRQTIWIGVDDDDWEYAVAHAVAHLKLHPHGWSSRFTPEEEQEAHWMASMWLAWGDSPIPGVTSEEAGT